MIITITLNPAIDKTAQVYDLKIGELNRLENVLIDAGGKGINVSKMISALGANSIACGFIGAKNEQVIIEKLNELNIKNDFVKINSNTRVNLKVIDKDAVLTELNEQGFEISQKDTELLEKKIASLSHSGNIFVFSGSIPKGAPLDIYERLIKIAHAGGAVCFADCEGEAFKYALNANPDFIKPNLFELKTYFGITEDLTQEKIIELCQGFGRRNIKIVSLTLGAQGALVLGGFDESAKNYQEGFFAKGLKIKAHSSVGAGDSFVGAFAYAYENNMSLEDSFKLAMACSAGAVCTQGTNPPDLELVNELKLKTEIVKLF